MPAYGPIITSYDIEDAVRTTLKTWLDTMLGEVERQSDGRWARRQIERPRSWELVTDFNAPSAGRLLPCVAVEAGPMDLNYSGDGYVNAEVGLNIVVLTKGQTRDATRETVAGLVAGILQVLLKHGDLDGFAATTVPGTITFDAAPAAMARTVAAARIPIAVVVDRVGSRYGGPEEPDDPPPTQLPPTSPTDPAHTETNVSVDDPR